MTRSHTTPAFKRLVGLVVMVLVFLQLLQALPAHAQGPGPSRPEPDLPEPAQQAQPVKRPLPDQYIVVMKPGADPHAVAAAVQVTPHHVFTHALQGFAAQLTPGQRAGLSHNPHVDFIEQDQEVTMAATQSTDSHGQPWGIGRIDQRFGPLSHTYTYNHTGRYIRAYIIDTGIQTSHPEFGGRALAGYDAFGGNAQDCTGHGTHVAGTVGGRTYGVAKEAVLVSVRVLDCTNTGSISKIIAGIDWILFRLTKPAVANMSLRAPFSTALNAAVQKLIDAGVFVAVAAGNDYNDACTFSPQSVSAAYTTAAADASDQRYVSSNYGSCVDGYAPGVEVKSATIGSSAVRMTGTSMAAPHVAGVAILYKHTVGDASQATINNWINTNATSGVIRGNFSGTPNRLLFKGSL